MTSPFGWFNTSMNENPNSGQNWGPVGGPGPQQSGPHPTPQQAPTGHYPNYGQPGAEYGQPGAEYGQYPAGPTSQYGVPPQAGPSYFTLLPLPVKLALGAGLFGVITFFMGFLSWVTVGESLERDADRWAMNQDGDFGIPAFLTMVFTPGWFLLGLSAAGVFAFGFVAVKLRRFLPHVAALTVICWLGLLACALALPGFISLGAGAIVALILGAFQTLLIGVATVMDGMNDDQ